MSSNIVLIGFMGSGKSTIGRMLSKSSSRYFIDTDALIEAREGRQIRDIFASNGEAYFRGLEKELFEWLSTNVTNAVISTGGGMPTAVDGLQRLGKTVLLDIGFENLLDRLKADEFDKRPLFSNVEFAKKLYESRVPVYKKQADITLDATLSAEEIVAQITSLC